MANVNELDLAGFRIRTVGDHGPAVVIFHGFGAPGDDLVPLARGLRPGRRYLFPEAPIALPPTYGNGRAWWEIDMMKLQLAMMTGVPRDLSEDHPDSLPALRKRIDELMDAVDETFQLDGAPVNVGGFSQGAMLACDWSMHTKRSVGTLSILSGTLLARDWWLPRMASLKETSVLQSHGTDDPVLVIDGATALRDALQEAGVQVDWHTFAGGHGIPPQILNQLDQQLPG